MWENDMFDELYDSVDEYGICYESECCGYVRESSIYEAIAEYELMDIWD